MKGGEARRGATGQGTSPASDHVALQDRPVKGAPCGRVAARCNAAKLRIGRVCQGCLIGWRAEAVGAEAGAVKEAQPRPFAELGEHVAGFDAQEDGQVVTAPVARGVAGDDRGDPLPAGGRARRPGYVRPEKRKVVRQRRTTENLAYASVRFRYLAGDGLLGRAEGPENSADFHPCRVMNSARRTGAMVSDAHTRSADLIRSDQMGEP